MITFNEWSSTHIKDKHIERKELAFDPERLGTTIQKVCHSLFQFRGNAE